MRIRESAEEWMLEHQRAEEVGVPVGVPVDVGGGVGDVESGVEEVEDGTGTTEYPVVEEDTVVEEDPVIEEQVQQDDLFFLETKSITGRINHYFTHGFYKFNRRKVKKNWLAYLHCSVQGCKAR